MGASCSRPTGVRGELKASRGLGKMCFCPCKHMRCDTDSVVVLEARTQMRCVTDSVVVLEARTQTRV